MLVSIALILLCGLLFGYLCEKVNVPSLFGMIIAGIMIGPYCLNLLDSSILDISLQLRKIALIIILIRAGLKLNLSDLKKVGVSSFLMCFLPATFEIIGYVLLAPKLLHITMLEAAILGSVIAAVSPAVVVPRMIRLMDQGYGTKQSIPQMILAGSSVDDVFVIVVFTSFCNVALNQDIQFMSFVNIPLSILLGIVIGLFVGYGLHKLFCQFNVHIIHQAIILFSVCFILNWLEDVQSIIPFASLIAIMALGSKVNKINHNMAVQLSGVFDGLWIPAQIFLFVLLGASVAVDSIGNSGFSAIVLIFMALIFRMIGVLISTLFIQLNVKERLFVLLAYTPKATVQAAIGGLPLSYGLSCGNTILTVSVLAILITAPLGAFAIDRTYKIWLSKE